MRVTIVDSGVANLLSIASAMEYLGAEIEVTSDSSKILSSEKLILPGVGSYSTAMNALRARGLEAPILAAVLEKKTSILGVCLGMQLMGASSTEHGETTGLGLLDFKVDRFPPKPGCKIPHVGFNEVIPQDGSILFSGLGSRSDFYFTHSYRVQMNVLDPGTARCDYNSPFVAAFEKENIFGVQFHPELSQSNGLKLLDNFLGYE